MKYCYECSEKLVIKECFNHGVSDGFFPFCPKCNEFRFQFFNVAVSAIIFNKEHSKVLLIKQYGMGRNILVAGYVNCKETLEEALKREIKEEVNLNVCDICYNESKYYEKSNTLICNFVVTADSESFKLTQEVDSAQWFTIEEAVKEIYKNSLAEHFLGLAINKANVVS